MADSAVVVNGVYRKLKEVDIVNEGVYCKSKEVPVVVNGVYRKGYTGRSEYWAEGYFISTSPYATADGCAQMSFTPPYIEEYGSNTIRIEGAVGGAITLSSSLTNSLYSSGKRYAHGKATILQDGGKNTVLSSLSAAGHYGNETSYVQRLFSPNYYTTWNVNDIEEISTNTTRTGTILIDPSNSLTLQIQIQAPKDIYGRLETEWFHSKSSAFPKWQLELTFS